MKAALYLRVSTGMQTIENQRAGVEHLAAARGHEIVDVFQEQVSATARRPEYERLMNAARRGKFRVLIIWALDRFGRSMDGNLRAVLELDRLGVQIISLSEPWLDTGGPVRDLLVAIFSWVAQQERARLIERTNAGLARARAAGKVIGRPRVKLPADWKGIISLWRDGDGTVKELALRLGCSVGKAHALAKEEEAA